MAKTDPKTMPDLASAVQNHLQQIQDKFQTMSDQIIGRLGDISSRIDDLEKNITNLVTQAKVEELESENEILATQKSGRLLIIDPEIWDTERRPAGFLS
ncbi:Heat shock factor-binding protein 1 [Tupaia chinensis]|uniref:Heat shock factor-binding protein 1 n=1 Tax=Tupaia chinensis TaxID=246437 RepID=L9KU99_TUPCH|nr:Heat shock factor-binding protein 1 [Tupaia chinensis]